MPGEAKTADFLLGDATLMLGPTDDILDLTPEDHGVGLVKAVSISSETSFTELTQGVKNTRVASVMTGNNVQLSSEVYEYTARNLTYAAGLDGNLITDMAVKANLASPIAAADTTFDVGSGEAAGISVGQWVVIGNADRVFVRKVTAIAGDSLTVDKAFTDSVPAGEVVYAKNLIEIGKKDTQPYLGCKVFGYDANQESITLLFPKVRVTSGFSLGFSSDDFQNMPFEMQMYDLTASESMFDMFGGAQGFALV